MNGLAVAGTTMLAMLRVPARAAERSVGSGAVHGTEGGSSQGDEQPGMVPNVGGDRFTADESGADEVEGVTCMGVGTGRTDGGTAVPATDE